MYLYTYIYLHQSYISLYRDLFNAVYDHLRGTVWSFAHGGFTCFSRRDLATTVVVGCCWRVSICLDIHSVDSLWALMSSQFERKCGSILLFWYIYIHIYIYIYISIYIWYMFIQILGWEGPTKRLGSYDFRLARQAASGYCGGINPRPQPGLGWRNVGSLSWGSKIETLLYTQTDWSVVFFCSEPSSNHQHLFYTGWFFFQVLGMIRHRTLDTW